MTSPLRLPCPGESLSYVADLKPAEGKAFHVRKGSFVNSHPPTRKGGEEPTRLYLRTIQPAVYGLPPRGETRTSISPGSLNGCRTRRQHDETGGGDPNEVYPPYASAPRRGRAVGPRRARGGSATI